MRSLEREVYYVFRGRISKKKKEICISDRWLILLPGQFEFTFSDKTPAKQCRGMHHDSFKQRVATQAKQHLYPWQQRRRRRHHSLPEPDRRRTEQTLRTTCHGDNLQARKGAEQSLTGTAESGMSCWGESMLLRTLTGMQEQPRSERPQSKQHASLIFL